MKKTLGFENTGARWAVLGIVAVLGFASFMYANPPTMGRAWTKAGITTQTDRTGANHNRTPDDLLW